MGHSGEKLMIYAPYAIWGPHFETDLELAQRHIDSGGEVVFLYCTGELLTCFPNQNHSKSVCRMCLSRFRKGIEWLGTSKVTAKNFLHLTPEQQGEIDQLAVRKFSLLKEIRAFTLHGADIGVAAISSVISILREPKPDILEHGLLIRNNLISAARVFFSLYNHISTERPDRLVVFNGRYAQLRPALSAAKILGVKTLVHERAGVLERFSLMTDTTPHDINAIQVEMQRISRSFRCAEEVREKIAREWFEERRHNVTQGWESFTKQQKRGHLPDLAKDRLNLAIFISSEDEMEAFEEWRSPIYLNQNDGIQQLLSDERITKKFKIFVREHPNLVGIDNSQTRMLRELACRFKGNFCFISGDSPVSTYSLVDECDLVLTFGSTVGIEAVYRDKASFLMGKAYYEHLGCCVVPGSHNELVEKLLAFAEGNRSMLPTAQTCREAIVTYGLFNKQWGHLFKYAQVVDLRTMRMKRSDKTIRLRPSLFPWLLYQGENLLNCGRKP
jgi:hypothetical protein